MAYQNAPIQEAVFEIAVDRIKIKQVEDLLIIWETLKTEFPNEKKKQNFSSTFQFSPRTTVGNTAGGELAGYILSSIDQKRQIQISPDGITFNVLKPYESWEAHFNTFFKIWQSFEKHFAPNKIIRQSLRYINRIDIPYPFDSFQEYITNMPPIPQCLPQTFESFFMQTAVPFANGDRKAIISETIEAIENNKLPFILDIDVSQEKNLQNSSESIISNFNELRLEKNAIFENCLTNKTRQLFL